MILADTSAWVEYDRATGSRVERRLEELIEVAGPVAITEPVIMELVAGARTDEREQQIRRLLGRFALLRFDAAADFDSASRIYRRRGRAGITPRGMVDCLIASVAHRHGATLLAADVDLSTVAGIIGIDLGRACVTS
jgi:predicted nucleic acid-binding protein